MNESKPLYQLCEEWRERVTYIIRVYAHPQDYSDTKQEGVGEGIEECAEELEQALRAWDAHLASKECNGMPEIADWSREQILGIKP